MGVVERVELFWLLGMAILVVGLVAMWFRWPARKFEGSRSVSQIYDHWTEDRMLEHYWGGHLHAGYYGDPPVRKRFIQAKEDMVDEMLSWGLELAGERLRAQWMDGEGEPVALLDVGCGLGGTVQHLARRWPDNLAVTGVTLSAAQARRAAELAEEEGLKNTAFFVGDALVQALPDASFDIVWTLEVEPHIPDNEVFVREMVRVLKPGGLLVMGTWNLRDTRERPLNRREARWMRFLLDEWNHAKFSSIADCVELFAAAGLEGVEAANWTRQTVPTWRESFIEPFRRPAVLFETLRYRFVPVLRDGYTLILYDRAFRRGLLEYGLFRGRK